MLIAAAVTIVIVSLLDSLLFYATSSRPRLPLRCGRFLAGSSELIFFLLLMVVADVLVRYYVEPFARITD